MLARPPRFVLGLRGRIVGAVLVTAVVVLGVAAVALLGPLESVLKNAAKTTLQRELRNNTTLASFRDAHPELVTYTKIKWWLAPAKQRAIEHALYLKGTQEQSLLEDRQSDLEQKLNAAEVNLLGYAGVSDHPQLVVVWPPHSSIALTDSYRDAYTALHGAHPHPIYTLGTIGGTDYVEAALPFTTPVGKTAESAHWVLAIRKKIDEIPGAVHAVGKAFLYAALAGLALTLILGIPLASTVVRRLRRLRQAALQVARLGPTVEVPEDRARDEVGDLARAFGTMRRQLQQQEEARRAFVATASHELRTPLTSLEGLLELLGEDLQGAEPDLEDARSLVERARAQSRRLGRLAADLLDLSRIDARVQLRSEPVELGELSRAVIAEFELGTAARDLQLELDDAGGQVWAHGDPGSIARILRILIENAIRVSPSGAEIRVELRNGERSSLRVCDQGPGVDPQERELIFERFQRGRATGGQAGFGLGLAIGRELAERMGGELVLDESDGPGARFELRLPAARAPEGELLGV